MKKGRVIKVCSHKPIIVFELDKVEYYASDKTGIEDFYGDLVINFTKDRDTPNNSEKFSQLKQYFSNNFEELQVIWPDFNLPFVKDEFWQVLHRFIKENNWVRICFHCYGGHGRTGTALAAMLIANVEYSVNEAIDWVREIYCKDAIESEAQIKYLYMLDKKFNNRDPDRDNLAIPSFQNIPIMSQEWVSQQYYEEDEFNYKFVDDIDC